MEPPVRRALLVLLLALLALPLLPPAPAAAEPVHYRRLTFPVAGRASYSNDWGAPRSGGRTHKGNDIFGAKLTPLVAARSGRIGTARPDNGGLSGNLLTVIDDEGWSYWYMHINNDSPGTDDGANPPAWRFAPGMAPGVRVEAGQTVAWLGDSGNAEGTPPHLHFELHRPDGTAVNPYHSLMLAQGRRVNDRCRPDDNPQWRPSAESGGGYWTLGADGGIFSFGDADFHGSMGGRRLNAPVLGLTPTPGGRGYWLTAGDGGIFSFGDARFHGSTGAMRLNQPVVGMARTPSGGGYWLVAADGGIFSFGDARFFGSTGSLRLNQPIIAMAPTPSGGGYWLVAADGGIFSFGDARFAGSAGGAPVGRVVGMAPTPSGGGYWLVTAEGRVLPYGDAPWVGDVAAIGFCSPSPVVQVAASATGRGYWLQTASGRLWPFGDAADHADTLRRGIRTAGIIDVATTG